MTVVVLMGPPGAGKGTQAIALADRLGVPAISTGDIFRASVAGGTELGRQAQGYLDGGEYVPDELTNAMLRDRLAAADTRQGFVLDGFPRTIDQVAVLDELLARPVDAVVVLEADTDQLVQRLLQRAEVEHRSDDTEDVIKRRLQVYHQQTIPVVEAYRERDLVIRLDGSGDVAEVAQRVLDLADSLLDRSQ